MCRKPKVTATKTDTTATAPPSTIVYSRYEIAQHNSPSSAWCIVHGKVLDITEFAKRHPGGDVILLAAGIDATTLVETYHPAGYPAKSIAKLEIGRIKESNDDDSSSIPPTFYSWNESEFYSVLKQRVVQRLRELKLNRRGSTEIWIKAALILIGFWYSMYQMYTTPFVQACLWSMIMGVFAHFVGTCIQHDGNHGAFSKSPLLNKVAGWTMDMIGASGFTWELQHMLGHHPYTNLLDTHEADNQAKGIIDGNKDQESDPDVFSSFPFMRMHPHQTPAWYHKYQHLYAPFLFAFMTILKVFQQDFEIVTSKKLYHIDAHCRYGDPWNVARFWVMKVVSMVYMLVVPCCIHGIGGGLFLFVLGHLTCGEVLATMFIVNHVIEGVAYIAKNRKDEDTTTRPQTLQGVTPMVETVQKTSHKQVPLHDWAAVQCQTSVNWAPGSWFWNHVSGGLSHQIEHHLFPSLCHTHYVYIQSVVQQTCEEYGVPYQAEPSLYTAYGKMMRHLQTLGRPEEEPVPSPFVKAKSE
mmetsp:Transcript_20227/g.30656  ORF Transcript_20227/g.30656 Transcript_20227/m.30656 type:complete len:523 (-) Transcript_20227:239-1807(-)